MLLQGKELLSCQYWQSSCLDGFIESCVIVLRKRDKFNHRHVGHFEVLGTVDKLTYCLVLLRHYIQSTMFLLR